MDSDTFESQPTLQGDLVHIRPLSANDFADLFDVAKDPGIWEQHPARHRYREPVFREFFDQAMKSGGALRVSDAHDGSVIGSSRFAAWSHARSEVEIGWTFLARRCWGGRYNAELKSLMLRHAFGYFDSVVFNVGAQNLRSQRAVLKLGASEEARFIDEAAPHVRYRLTRAAYESFTAMPSASGTPCRRTSPA